MNGRYHSSFEVLENIDLELIDDLTALECEEILLFMVKPSEILGHD